MILVSGLGSVNDRSALTCLIVQILSKPTPAREYKPKRWQIQYERCDVSVMTDGAG